MPAQVCWSVLLWRSWRLVLNTT